MSKKYFVSAQGRDFTVTLDSCDASGQCRVQITSEAGHAERLGRVVGGAAEIDGRMLKLEALCDDPSRPESVQLGNRRQRLECSVSDRPKLEAAQTALGPRARHRVHRAPLPGQVAGVLVRPDDRVSAGQRLVLIEAMKMQNPILAERDGRVLQVFVSPGDTVQVGAQLVELGD